MKQSDLNHLRRLLGWVRCDIGQDPAGQQQTMIDIAGKLGADSIDADAKARLVEGYRRAEAVPVYVRDAVKALEKALTAVGRDPGVVAPRATAETRANTGFDPGAGAGREPVLDDVQIEAGLAEIGVYVWGQRGEDWLAGVEYLARLLRAGEACPAVAPHQNHPDATAWPVACRDTPAAAPILRRDDTGGVGAARRSAAAHGAPEVQVDRASAGQAESCRSAINLQVMQEALRLMPSDEARRVAREAEASPGVRTPEQYVGAGAVAVIAKLRAPVSSIHEGFELTYASDAEDPACAADLSHFTNGWRACLMSQVRAPVADERQAVAYLDLGAGGYMDVGTDLTDKQLAALPKGRHMLAIIGTHGVDGYTPASAPVTDLRPHLEWALRRIRTSLDTGDKYEAAQAALDAAKAAPQASALAEEYTRGRADGFDAGYSAALEKAAALVGGHTWAGASQIVSDLIAEHIRALKTQADKDGGQRRAGDEQPDFMQPRMTPWGRLVRACRIILGTTLMDMSRALGMPPSDLSAYECDHQRLTDDVILAVMRFFDERGLCIPATAWRKAARASARTALSGTQAGQGERQ